MYAPKQFREDRSDVLISAMRSIQLAAIVAHVEAELDVAHLPVVVREGPRGIAIEGHVALGNPFWKMVANCARGLAIFQGPHAYVHPGWYESKKATGKVVPTWNYLAIHVRGCLSIERDPAWLRDHLNTLTSVNESARTEPWSISDAPEDYIEAMLQAIVGVRLEIEAMEGVWKMGQHHSEANRLGVVAGLSTEDNSNAQAVATLMRGLEQS